MMVRIITNSKGSGDWVIVILEGDEIFAGHSISPQDLHNILEATAGYEFIEYHELTDEEIENWEEVIYK